MAAVSAVFPFFVFGCKETVMMIMMMTIDDDDAVDY